MKNSVRYLKIFANLLVAVLGIVAVLYFVPRLIIFFMPFVVGYLISLIANPLVRFFEKHLKIVRKHGSIIIIVGRTGAGHSPSVLGSDEDWTGGHKPGWQSSGDL